MFDFTPYYPYEDTVYKHQRIEQQQAFRRSIPEGAHIFQVAKCIGAYKWFDKQEFNRLAFSGHDHQQFDGTGKGAEKRAKTSLMVAIQPYDIDTAHRDGTEFRRISVRLYCRNANVPDVCRPDLSQHVVLCNEGEDGIYYEGLGIFCESQRIRSSLKVSRNSMEGSIECVLRMFQGLIIYLPCQHGELRPKH